MSDFVRAIVRGHALLPRTNPAVRAMRAARLLSPLARRLLLSLACVELTAFLGIPGHGAVHRRNVMKTRILVATFACVATAFQFITTVTVLYI